MIEHVVKRGEQQAFEWIDLDSPTPDELAYIAKTYDLHETSVKDSIQPEHLPKHESFDEITFFIARSYDEQSTHDADTVRELTRKVACFVGPSFVITIHRSEQPYLTALKKRWQAKSAKGTQLSSVQHLVNEILLGVVGSYANPIADCQARFDILEHDTFEPGGREPSLHDAYILTRAASVYRRMLRGVIDVVAKLNSLPEASVPFFQDLREEAESLLIQANDLVDDVNRILQLQITLTSQRTNAASQRTNEVMRVLTVFSLFFMPLNLIAGIYGMNFAFMPELQYRYAYPIVLTVMAAIALLTFLWFRRRGWLRRGDGISHFL